jgi:hypothetical protein
MSTSSQKRLLKANRLKPVDLDLAMDINLWNPMLIVASLSHRSLNPSLTYVLNGSKK